MWKFSKSFIFFVTKVLMSRLNIWLLRNSENDPFQWGYLENPSLLFLKMHKITVRRWDLLSLAQELSLKGSRNLGLKQEVTSSSPVQKLPFHNSLSVTLLTFFRIIILLFPFIFITCVLSCVLEPCFPLAQTGVNFVSL